MKGWSVMDCPGLIDLALSYVPLFQLELLNHPLHKSLTLGCKVKNNPVPKKSWFLCSMHRYETFEGGAKV